MAATLDTPLPAGSAAPAESAKRVPAEADPRRLSPPHIYLLRMAVFVVLAGFAVLILNQTVWRAFLANPGLNGLIVGVALVGIFLSFRQVIRLFREVRWANAFARQPDAAPPEPPVLLRPLAALIGDRIGRAGVSTTTLRHVLDSIGLRLDESRDLGRYLTGLLIFLGLLGTFWGLIETVTSVGGIIKTMRGGGDASLMFEDLKANLERPLSGMGISFSSSLFGLAGSLVLGFLDLQAGQAQNRFYNELEDWLSANVSDALPMAGAPADWNTAIERLRATIAEGGGNRAAVSAMANLAEGIQALVHHMRAEQQMIRDWAEAQAARDRDLRRLLERIAEREPG